MKSRNLILVRHGQSEWNAKNLFTGWKDPGLTDQGVSEAKNAGKLISEQNIEFDIMYGEGISKMGELLDLGVAAGIVDKSGAWISYNGQRIGQGRENAKTFLRENPEIADEIEAAIRQNAGLVGDQMLDNSIAESAEAVVPVSSDLPESDVS